MWLLHAVAESEAVKEQIEVRWSSRFGTFKVTGFRSPDLKQREFFLLSIPSARSLRLYARP